jgi:hypothetical protein
MNPVVEFLVTYGIGKSMDMTGAAAIDFATANTRRLLEARSGRLAEFAAQSTEQMRQALARLTAVEREQLERKMTDERLAELWLEFGADAQKEVIDERRQMIAHASACLVDMSIDIGQASRIRRIINELDARDVLVLRALWMVPDIQVPGLQKMNLQMKVWQDIGAEALEPAGCVRVGVGGGGMSAPPTEELRVTETGKLVLRALRSFLHARVPIFGLDCQMDRHDYRSRDAAIAMVREHQGLYETMLKAAEPRFSGVRFDGAGHQGDPPAPDVMGRISFSASNLSCPDFGVKEADQPGVGTVNKIWVTSRAIVESQDYYVQVHGPFDVMRELALELDARWG